MNLLRHNRRGTLVAGLLTGQHASISLAWMATYRKRLHLAMAGGKHLTVVVIWDTGGGDAQRLDDADRHAIHAIANGPSEAPAYDPSMN